MQAVPPGPKVFTYYATVLRMHDGDTIFCRVDLGMGIWNIGDNPDQGLGIRFAGINAPELSTAAGKDAAAYLNTLIRPGDTVRLESIAWNEHEKYGRLLCTVYLLDGTNVCQQMIDTGHAVAYNPTLAEVDPC